MDALKDPSLIILFGIAAPFLVSLMKRPEWPGWVKHLIVVLVATGFAVVAIVVQISAGVDVHWSLTTVIGYMAAIALIAQTLYELVLNDAGLAAGSVLASLNTRIEQIGAAPDDGGSATDEGGETTAAVPASKPQTQATGGGSSNV